MIGPGERIFDRFGKRRRLFFGSIQFRVLHSDFASLRCGLEPEGELCILKSAYLAPADV
jgi:hypothetical protein